MLTAPKNEDSNSASISDSAAREDGSNMGISSVYSGADRTQSSQMAASESFDDSSDEFAANTSVSAPVNKIDNDLASSSYYSDEEEEVLDEVRSPSVDNSILDTSNDMPHINKLSGERTPTNK